MRDEAPFLHNTQKGQPRVNGGLSPNAEGENKMKKLMFVLVALALLAIPSAAIADEPDRCTTIQSGMITDSASNPLTVGYDQFGYNYQAHMFSGRYCDYDRVIGGPYCDVNLIMKWNDAWISNTDCNGDGKLDRYYGHDSYIGSGAWLTNHMWGTYEQDGTICEWDYFTKIIAAPADAYEVGGIWYAADGTEIGPVIWGAFATIQQVENDPCVGIEGMQYLSPDHLGFGGW
jgi:hypothetical protein